MNLLATQENVFICYMCIIQTFSVARLFFYLEVLTEILNLTIFPVYLNETCCPFLWLKLYVLSRINLFQQIFKKH